MKIRILNSNGSLLKVGSIHEATKDGYNIYKVHDKERLVYWKFASGHVEVIPYIASESVITTNDIAGQPISLKSQSPIILVDNKRQEYLTMLGQILSGILSSDAGANTTSKGVTEDAFCICDLVFEKLKERENG